MQHNSSSSCSLVVLKDVFRLRELEEEAWGDPTRCFLYATPLVRGFPWRTVITSHPPPPTTAPMMNSSTSSSSSSSSSRVLYFSARRHVVPYDFTFKVFAKGRWVGRFLLSVYSEEFSHHSKAYYSACINQGRLRCVPRSVLQEKYNCSRRFPLPMKKHQKCSSVSPLTTTILPLSGVQDDQVDDATSLPSVVAGTTSATTISDNVEDKKNRNRNNNILRRVTKRCREMDLVDAFSPPTQQVVSLQQKKCVDGGGKEKEEKEGVSGRSGAELQKTAHAEEAPPHSDSFSNSIPGLSSSCCFVGSSPSHSTVAESSPHYTTPPSPSSNKISPILHHGDLILHTVHRHEIPVSLGASGVDPVELVAVRVHRYGLLAVHKPCGLPSHATGRYHYNSVVAMLSYTLAPRRLKAWLMEEDPLLQSLVSTRRLTRQEKAELYEYYSPFPASVLQRSSGECGREINKKSGIEIKEEKTKGKQKRGGQEWMWKMNEGDKVEGEETKRETCSSERTASLLPLTTTEIAASSATTAAEVALDKVPRPCHRLDRATSGLLLLGISEEATSRLSRALMKKTNAMTAYLEKGEEFPSHFSPSSKKEAATKTASSSTSTAVAVERRSLTAMSSPSSSAGEMRMDEMSSLLSLGVYKRYLARVRGDWGGEKGTRCTTSSSPHRLVKVPPCCPTQVPPCPTRADIQTKCMNPSSSPPLSPSLPDRAGAAWYPPPEDQPRGRMEKRKAVAMLSSRWTSPPPSPILVPLQALEVHNHLTQQAASQCFRSHFTAATSGEEREGGNEEVETQRKKRNEEGEGKQERARATVRCGRGSTLLPYQWPPVSSTSSDFASSCTCFPHGVLLTSLLSADSFEKSNREGDGKEIEGNREETTCPMSSSRNHRHTCAEEGFLASCVHISSSSCTRTQNTKEQAEKEEDKEDRRGSRGESGRVWRAATLVQRLIPSLSTEETFSPVEHRQTSTHSTCWKKYGALTPTEETDKKNDSHIASIAPILQERHDPSSRSVSAGAGDDDDTLMPPPPLPPRPAPHPSSSSLLLCLPLTGRFHQIRDHLNDYGHPILGEEVEEEGNERQMGLSSLSCGSLPDKEVLYFQPHLLPAGYLTLYEAALTSLTSFRYGGGNKRKSKEEDFFSKAQKRNKSGEKQRSEEEDNIEDKEEEKEPLCYECAHWLPEAVLPFPSPPYVSQLKGEEGFHSHSRSFAKEDYSMPTNELFTPAGHPSDDFHHHQNNSNDHHLEDKGNLFPSVLHVDLENCPLWTSPELCLHAWSYTVEEDIILSPSFRNKKVSLLTTGLSPLCSSSSSALEPQQLQHPLPLSVSNPPYKEQRGGRTLPSTYLKELDKGKNEEIRKDALDSDEMDEENHTAHCWLTHLPCYQVHSSSARRTATADAPLAESSSASSPSRMASPSTNITRTFVTFCSGRLPEWVL